MGCCKEKSTESSCSTETTGSCGDKTGACDDKAGGGGGCGSKSQCCPGTVIKGALVGGILMFIWFSASWMVLPWHKDIMSFKNESMASATLSNLAPQSGIYKLPNAMEPGSLAVTKPYAFVSVFTDGISAGDMKQALIKDFLLCLFGAALLTKILKKRRCGGCPVAFSMVIGLLVGAFSYLPNMIWFHFPLHFSLVGMADDVIAITLAGAAISKCILKSGGQCGDKGKCESGPPKSPNYQSNICP